MKADAHVPLMDAIKFFGCLFASLMLLWFTRWSSYSFLSFFLYNSLAFLFLIKYLKTDIFKNFSLIVIGFSISLTIAEIGFVITDLYEKSGETQMASPSASPVTYRKEESCPEGTSRPDTNLGYRGKNGPRTCRVQNFRNDQIIYDVNYELNQHGFRETPNVNKKGESLLFFGGSFTFGEGVDSNQTLPYFVSQKLLHQFNVVNLGWPGWGPHQMLRIVESGTLKELVPSNVDTAVYQTVIWHAARAAGHAQWDKHGPKYRITDGGEVYFIGPFKTKRRLYIERVLSHSRLFKWILKRPLKITEQDMEVFLGIISKTSVLLEEQYGVPLTILYWRFGGNSSQYAGYSDDMVMEKLRSKGLTVLEVSEASQGDPKMRIEGDGHPSALAHSLNAEIVSSFIQQINDQTQ